MYTKNISFQTTPTIKSNPTLNVAEAATTLRNAMKGIGTDEDKIISVLTTCSNSQRQEIAKAYNAEFGKVLTISSSCPSQDDQQFLNR